MSPDCATNTPGEMSRARGYQQDEPDPAIDQRSKLERIEVATGEPYHERRCQPALGRRPFLERVRLQRQTVLRRIVDAPSYQVYKSRGSKRRPQSRHARTNRGGNGCTGAHVHQEILIAGTKESLECFPGAFDHCEADGVERAEAGRNHRETVGIYEAGGEISQCNAHLIRAGLGRERVIRALQRSGNGEAKRRDPGTESGEGRGDAFVRLHSGRAPGSGERFARRS